MLKLKETQLRVPLAYVSFKNINILLSRSSFPEETPTLLTEPLSAILKTSQFTRSPYPGLLTPGTGFHFLHHRHHHHHHHHHQDWPLKSEHWWGNVKWPVLKPWWPIIYMLDHWIYECFSTFFHYHPLYGSFLDTFFSNHCPIHRMWNF